MLGIFSNTFSSSDHSSLSTILSTSDPLPTLSDVDDGGDVVDGERYDRGGERAVVISSLVEASDGCLSEGGAEGMIRELRVRCGMDGRLSEDVSGNEGNEEEEDDWRGEEFEELQHISFTEFCYLITQKDS